jgi:tetratricopeptide (TPR) repeat protein
VDATITGKQKSSSSGRKWFDIFEKYQHWLLFLFAVLLYSNTLNYGYVLDDGLMIKENSFTLKGIHGIGDILTHDQFAGIAGAQDNPIYKGGRYRPLSQVTFAIEYQLFKLNPFVGHLINIMLYGLLAVLIFFLLKNLFKDKIGNSWYASIPFIATAIFIAHPLHTEVVANIKSRDEIMGMMGGILVLIYSLKYFERKKISYLILSFLFFFLGLLSKESVITFLAIVPMTLFVFKKISIKEHIIILSPLIVASAIYFCIRFLVVGNTNGHAVAAELFHNPFMYATTTERYATIMLTWLKYLILLIFPHPLTHDYYPKQIPIIGWADIRAILPLLIYAALIAFALIKIWKKNIFAFGILFFLITFSVTSNLFFDLGLFMNERFMFTPLLGFALLAACLLVKIKSQKIITFIFIPILVLYSIKTISRNTAWESDFKLFTTDVKTSVNSGRCNVIAGSLILNKARTETNISKQTEQYKQAEEYLNKGLGIYSENEAGWSCLGEVQIYLGKYDEAVKSLAEVFRFDSTNANSQNNLLFIATKFEEKNLHSKALDVYKILFKHNPVSPVYMYNIADVYQKTGKLDTALVLLERAIKLKPDYYDAYNRIAGFYGQYKKNYTKAIEYLNESYSRNPKYFSTLENLGIIYGLKADFNNSLLYFKEAYRVDSANAQLCINIGRTYDMLHDKINANEFYQKANKFSEKK